VRPVHDLLTALGFMTRLGPARAATAEEIGAAMAWLPVTGLAVGLLAAAPAYFGLFAGRPWVQALVGVCLSVWATRALHWDGWADVWDGWGSGATGERFWEIVKDSRVGAFGVLGLVLGVGAQLVLLREAFAAGAPGAAAFCCVLGRGAAVVLAALGRDLARPGLGRAFLAGATGGAVAFAAGACLACGLWLEGGVPLAAGAALCVPLVWGLLALARRQGALNGDFLGCCIVGGELAALFGFALAG
jgi:adenosylcobinamide-GDP ribazoletransferase